MMNNDKKNYRYQLESKKLTGHQPRKLSCPQCGRRKCLVRYVDTRNGFQYVGDSVGKCDHEQSCGYHYTPAQYYRDTHTEADAPGGKPWTPPPLPPFQPLPMELVVRSHSPQSTLWQWIATVAAPRLQVCPQRLAEVYDDYLLGATRRSDVIFWQVDQQGRVHGGHIMQYHADGHRGGYQGWTHLPLIRRGELPLDWQLYQCLYGEHLLPCRPDAHVCIVESEKTALLMALLQPDHLWLATAGCGGLSTERLAPLAGRRVTLFPDSGSYQKWAQRMQSVHGISYNITDALERYPPNTDLADIALGEVSVGEVTVGEVQEPQP